jgi:hypothetical protein
LCCVCSEIQISRELNKFQAQDGAFHYCAKCDDKGQNMGQPKAQL